MHLKSSTEAEERKNGPSIIFVLGCDSFNSFTFTVLNYFSRKDFGDFGVAELIRLITTSNRLRTLIEE